MKSIVQKLHREIFHITKDVFSNNYITYGKMVCLYNKEQFEAFNQFLYETIIQLPYELINEIVKFTDFNKNNIGSYGLSEFVNYIALMSTSKYGRKLNKTLKFVDEQFPKGSGPNGDMYDMGYYHGKFYDEETKNEITDDEDLNDFIVDDNEIEYVSDEESGDDDDDEYFTSEDESDRDN